MRCLHCNLNQLSPSNAPLRQAYQGGQAQADSRELMGSFALTVAYTCRSLQLTDAVRERGRRMAILVCLPDCTISKVVKRVMHAPQQARILTCPASNSSKSST